MKEATPQRARASRAPARGASCVYVVALSLAFAAALPSAARASIADEVRKARTEIEAMLTAANVDLQRVPRAEKEATGEREKAAALKKEIDAAKAEAAAAEAPLEKLLAAAKSAEEELAAAKAKGAALAGWKKKAFAIVQAARKPSDALKDVVALALEERAVVEAALDRVLAEPGAQAAAALDELAKTAATPLPSADFEKLGAASRTKATLTQKPEATAMLDAFAGAIAEAAACAGVTPPDTAGRAPRIVAGPKQAAASFTETGKALTTKLRARREAVLREAKAQLPKLEALLGSKRLAGAAVKLAIARGLRDVVREAAKAALAVHSVPLAIAHEEAPAPKSQAAILRALAKRAGVECGGER